MERYIYALVCPLAREVRYIGQTKRSLHKRFKSHIYEYNRNKRNEKFSTHKFNWMKKVDGAGQLDQIQIRLLETCHAENVDEREIYWIGLYQNLVNSSPGGYSHSEETIRKIADSKRGEKNPMFGQKVTEEHRKKMVDGMRKSEKFKISRQSEEFKKKVSERASITLILLDENLNSIREFRNCRECAEFLGYKETNVTNAVRFSRPLGRWIKKVYWVVRKDSIEQSIQKIKNEPKNQYVLTNKKFGKYGGGRKKLDESA